MSAPAGVMAPVSHFQLVSASQFSIDELTAAYNQTRVDYLVPMPMNAARLAEYIQVYDVDLERSVVAVADKQIRGLGMLGVRPGRSWITRLGVLPGERRQGLGLALVRALLVSSEAAGVAQTVLEVIQNNVPAYDLFTRCQFEPTRELVVLRRPPGPPAMAPVGTARSLDRAEALTRLDARPGPEAWIMETASLAHVEGLKGLELALPDGSCGWLVYHEQRFKRFPLNLARLAISTERGDPVAVARALLAHLYLLYPDLDTHTENIAADDSHLAAFFEMGYVESFRRLEMHRSGSGRLAQAAPGGRALT